MSSLRIKDAAKDTLEKLVAGLEKELLKRPFKKVIVEFLSEKGYCSPKSSGFEYSFLAVLERANVSLKDAPSFVSIMGTQRSGTHPIVARLSQLNAAAAPAPEPTNSPNVPPVVPTGSAPPQLRLNPKGVSVIFVPADSAAQSQVVFTDGSEDYVGSDVVNAFNSSCRMLDLTASSV